MANDKNGIALTKGDRVIRADNLDAHGVVDAVEETAVSVHWAGAQSGPPSLIASALLVKDDSPAPKSSVEETKEKPKEKEIEEPAHRRHR